MRSAPTLKIWMTPFASVAMLEKLALLKIACWRAPAFLRASSARLRAVMSRRRTVKWRVPPSHISPTAISSGKRRPVLR